MLTGEGWEDLVLPLQQVVNQHNVTVLRRGEGRGSKGNEKGRGGEWIGGERRGGKEIWGVD